MGTNESTLRVAATLTSASRRGHLSDIQIKYMNTGEVIRFYEKNKSDIERYTCNLYVEELISLIDNVSDLDSSIDDLLRYNCGISSQIHSAIVSMIKSKNVETYLGRGYFHKLSRYIIFDDMIEAIRLGNVIVYEGIKDAFSTKKTEIVDTTFTLTDLNKEEVAVLSILYAMILLSISPSDSRVYILHDILKYVEHNKYIESEKLNVIMNQIGDALARGRLLSWNEEYMSKVSDLPSPSIDEQINMYNIEFRYILAHYPRPRV